MTRVFFLFFSAIVAVGGTGCQSKRNQSAAQASSASAAAALGPTLSAGARPARTLDNWPELKWYQWVGDSSRATPEPVDTVVDRFAGYLPNGYSTFADEPETISEWLRLLPLAAPGTPVKNTRGEVVVPGDDEHLAAVVAIDIGSADIQRSADVIVRLQAEWRWFMEEKEDAVPVGRQNRAAPAQVGRR